MAKFLKEARKAMEALTGLALGVGFLLQSCAVLVDSVAAAVR